MILITTTQRNGVSYAHTFAIDPEKIVSVRDREVGLSLVAEIEYGETYDRRRQPIFYRLNCSRAAIDALILGSYTGKEQLNVTVIDASDRHYKPYMVASYAMDLQERYIVDIREAEIMVNGSLTTCRRIEYVPGSFAPVILYVSNRLSTLITDTPEEVTTTTTEEATTTTTPELN
jgi:hypothetical protein